MTRVLVTGGSGFIGRRVVQRFAAMGYEVTSFSLPGEPVPARWPTEVRRVHGDLASRADVATAASECDLVVHLAAPVGVAGRYDWQWEILVDGTRRVCEAVAAQGGRLVVASSIAVYGTNIQTQCCREDDGFGPWAGAYGRAKQGQEAAALDVAQRRGAALTIVRPANVYGLGGSSAWGDRLLAAFEQSGGAVIGDADTNDAGLVYVDNLADALVLAATDERAIGQTYNVCDEQGVTWRRFADDMAALVDLPPPPAFPLDAALELVRANEDPANCTPPRDPGQLSMEGLNLIGFANRFDSGRIRAELGWQPQISYERALAEMAAQWTTRNRGVAA